MHGREALALLVVVVFFDFINGSLISILMHQLSNPTRKYGFVCIV